MSVLKHFVSKKKRRFQQNGYDLDLTYITDNIVAMGYPSEKLEGFVRNKADDVIRFFDQFHQDSYKVYNLCSERKYDPSKFHHRVAEYPFEDHNAPRFEMLKPCCEDIADWLSGNNEKNVVAIHCKAGKGRTGVIICSYLLHCGAFTDTKEALQFYGERRTQNAKGVTIPSQRRYVYYYSHMLRKRLTYTHTPLLLKSITLEGIPAFSNGICTPMFIVRQGQGAKIYQSEPHQDVKKTDKQIKIILPRPLPICGDLRIEFVHVSKMNKKEKMFQYWFNTFFIFHSCPTEEQELIDANSICGHFTAPMPEVPEKESVKHHKKAYQPPQPDSESTTSLPIPKSPSTSSLGSEEKASSDTHAASAPPVGIGLTRRMRQKGGSIRRSVSDLPPETINPVYCDEFHLNLPKWELDRAHKDKDCKQYPDSFRVITSISNPLSLDSEEFEVDPVVHDKRHELVDYNSDLSEDDDDDDVRDGSEVMGLHLKKKDYSNSGHSHSKAASKTSPNYSKHDEKAKISSKNSKAGPLTHLEATDSGGEFFEQRSHSNAMCVSLTEDKSPTSPPYDMKPPTSPPDDMKQPTSPPDDMKPPTLPPKQATRSPQKHANPPSSPPNDISQEKHPPSSNHYSAPPIPAKSSPSNPPTPTSPNLNSNPGARPSEMSF